MTTKLEEELRGIDGNTCQNKIFVMRGGCFDIQYQPCFACKGDKDYECGMYVPVSRYSAWRKGINEQ